MPRDFQSYRLIEVYQHISEVQAGHLAQFWLRTGAIPSPVEARRRTSEAVLLVHKTTMR